MPGHWGRPSRPSRDRHPPAPTPTPVTTAVAPPSVLSRPTPTYQNVHQTGAVTQTPGRTVIDPRPGGGDPGMTYTAPPVRTGGASPFAYTRRPNINPRNMRRINQLSNKKTFLPRNRYTGIGQFLSNMPKYWSLPSGIRKAIESGKIPIAHGFESEEVLNLMKKLGLEDIRPQAKFPPTTDAIEAATKALMKGNVKDAVTKLGQTKGAFTAIGPTAKEAFIGGQRYAKPGGVLAELGPAGVRGGSLGSAKAVAKGYIDPIHGYVDRGMTGNLQGRWNTGALNKAFNLGPKSAQVVGKPIAQSLLNKIGARVLPGANIALGATSTLGHLQAGNYGQALMAGLSMAPGPIGWAGLAGEYGLGALDKAMTSYRQDPNAPENTLVMNRGGRVRFSKGGLVDLYRYGGFSG